MTVLVAGELDVDVSEVPSDRVADNGVADDEVDAVFAGLGPEVLGLGADVEVELVEEVVVGLGDEDDLRLLERQSNKSLK